LTAAPFAPTIAPLLIIVIVTPADQPVSVIKAGVAAPVEPIVTPLSIVTITSLSTVPPAANVNVLIFKLLALDAIPNSVGGVPELAPNPNTVYPKFAIYLNPIIINYASLEAFVVKCNLIPCNLQSPAISSSDTSLPILK
jgi:hypothetical protein